MNHNSKEAIRMEVDAGFWPSDKPRGADKTPVLTDEYIKESWRRVDEEMLQYLKTSLQRLIDGERSGAVPEEMIPLCINRLKQRIKEKEDKLKNE